MFARVMNLATYLVGRNIRSLELKVEIILKISVLELRICKAYDVSDNKESEANPSKSKEVDV